MRKKSRTKYLCLSLSLFVTICVTFFSTAAFAQINIETLRKTDFEEGLHMNLSTKFGVLAGNSKNTTVSGKLRADYLFDNYHLFSVADWARGESNDQLYQDRGFIHLRGVKKLTPVYALEAFAQEEFNDFILIKERNLVGGGVRFSPFASSAKKPGDTNFSFHVGLGLMHETERFSEKTSENNTDILRSSNYFALKWKAREGVFFTTTCYYQVDTTRLADFRLLAEGSLGFNLTEQLLFTVNYSYRYDHEPPNGLKNFDLDITNGISYFF